MNYTSAHWYTHDALQRLVYAHQLNGTDLTVAQFVAQFAKLSRHGKRIAKRVGVYRLSEYVPEDPRIAELLAAMQEAAPAPAPNVLGQIGKAQMQRHVGTEGFRYKQIKGTFDRKGAQVPYVLEVAMAYRAQAEREVLVGINRSITYDTPFQGVLSVEKGRDSWRGHGLHGLLQSFRVDYDDPITVMVHLLCPALDYTDKAKTAIDVRPFADALAQGVYHACKHHYRVKKRIERENRIPVSYSKAPRRLTQKDAVFELMPDAIDQVSNGGKYQFTCRELYYTIRDRVYQRCGDELDYGYFRQSLLTEYGEPKLLYFGVRGAFLHPHSTQPIFLDSKVVEGYQLPTYGYHSLLYVEKLMASDALRDLALMERYDLAILHGQGFATRDMKKLLDHIAAADPNMRFFCAHDCDPEGFNIARTLQEETTTARARRGQIVDLGLRPEQAWELQLPVESKKVTREHEDALASLSEGERDWLLSGKRVELNGLSPLGFAEWLEQQLREQDAANKLIPPEPVIYETFHGQARASLQAAVEQAVQAQLTQILGAAPEELIDRAVEELAQRINPGAVRNDMIQVFQKAPPTSWRQFTEEMAANAARDVEPDLANVVASVLKNANPALWSSSHHG